MLLFRNVAIVEGVEVDNEQDIFVTSFVDIHLLYPPRLKIISKILMYQEIISKYLQKWLSHFEIPSVLIDIFLKRYF